jgi:hypothetical protein
VLEAVLVLGLELASVLLSKHYAVLFAVFEATLHNAAVGPFMSAEAVRNIVLSSLTFELAFKSFIIESKGGHRQELFVQIRIVLDH